MKVGDLVLVRYHNREEHIGIVVEVGSEWMTGDALVTWDDGDTSWIAKGNVEVINESG